MDIRKIASALHPLERKILPLLGTYHAIEPLVRTSKLKEVEVLRALQWLETKKAITITTEISQHINLDKNGIVYLKDKLPERRFLQALAEKELGISQIERKADITREELNVCLGMMQRRAAILLTKDKELRVKLTEQGKRFLTSQLPEEKILTLQYPLAVKTISPDDSRIIEGLLKRKNILKTEEHKHKTVQLTLLGTELLNSGVKDEHVIDQLTAEIIKNNSWKNKQFRAYDLGMNVPRQHTGKLQPYREFLEICRQKFIAMGFTESTGPIVEQEFWNMDALYMPQFHSARDIHDAYFVKQPTHTTLDPAILRAVKESHERGAGTGSTGWKYNFDLARTQRNILRSQDTANSARTLSSSDLKIPGKYFQIERCFRHDVIDATHLPDFDQVGGFVIEEGLNIRHLFGLLNSFAKEFAGIKETKIVPSYFPFTEPSCEIHGKHPDLGWIELGGAGMFRPEVVEPLVGKNISVIAWGLGVTRLAMFKLGTKDIRNLFSSDLQYLRNSPEVW